MFHSKFSHGFTVGYSLTRLRHSQEKTAAKSRLPGFAKKPLVFENNITVGHPGQVIAHGAVQAGLADAAARAFADFLRMREIIFKKLLEDFHRAQVWLMDDGVVIQILVKVLAQFEVQLAAFGAVLY